MANKTVSLSMDCYDTCGNPVHATIVYGGKARFGKSDTKNGTITELGSSDITVSQNTGITSTTVSDSSADTIPEVTYGNPAITRYYWGKYTNNANSSTEWTYLGSVTGSVAEPPIEYVTITVEKNEGISKLYVNGTEKSNGATVQVVKGSTVTFSVEAVSGYTLNSGSFETSKVLNSNYTFSPTATKDSSTVTSPQVEITFGIGDDDVMMISWGMHHDTTNIRYDGTPSVTPTTVSPAHNNSLGGVVYYRDNIDGPGHSVSVSLTVKRTVSTVSKFQIDVTFNTSPLWLINPSATVAGQTIMYGSTKNIELSFTSGDTYTFECTLSW